MKILVLGGTAFLGRAFVECATQRGHELTLFNRRQRAPGLFSELETIQGDRNVDLSLLDHRSWDAVFDTSGYVPRVVNLSARKCADWAQRYLFISSISVFKNFAVPHQTEDAEVAVLENPETEEISGETYGGLKALCEQSVERVFGNRAIVVRPGLIVGPTDYTDRFTYWPVRMNRGGKVLAPNLKTQPVQIVDVRDLASWCVRLLENGLSGRYNATGPEEPFTLQEVLEACEGPNKEPEIVWVDADFLAKHNVQPWSDLPLALDYDWSTNGMFQVDVSRALQSGLKLRPLRDTIRDTLEWAMTRPTDYQWRAGLSAEREAELLQNWLQTTESFTGGGLPQ